MTALPAVRVWDGMIIAGPWSAGAWGWLAGSAPAARGGADVIAELHPFSGWAWAAAGLLVASVFGAGIARRVAGGISGVRRERRVTSSVC